MLTFNRFGLRGFCGIVATILALGAADPVAAWNQPQRVRQLGTPGREDASAVATDRDGNVTFPELQTDGSVGSKQDTRTRGSQSIIPRGRCSGYGNSEHHPLTSPTTWQQTVTVTSTSPE